MHRPALLALLAAFATTGVWAVGSVQTKTADPSADDTDVPLTDERAPRDPVSEELDRGADEVHDRSGPPPGDGEAPGVVLPEDEGSQLASDGTEPMDEDVLELTHHDVKVKRYATPRYPKAGKKLGLDVVPCRVRVYIDERGVPYQVGFVSCRVEFRDSAREALMKWRWFPALNEQGRPTKATFAIVINYKLAA